MRALRLRKAGKAASKLCGLTHSFSEPWTAEVAEIYGKRHRKKHADLEPLELLSVAIYALYSAAALVVTSEDELEQIVVRGLDLIPLRLFAKSEKGLVEKRKWLMKAIYPRFSRLPLPDRQRAYAVHPVEHFAYLLKQLGRGKLEYEFDAGEHCLLLRVVVHICCISLFFSFR